MNKIPGLVVFWLAAAFVASYLSPHVAAVVGLIILVVVLTGLGSIVLSAVFRDGSSHLLAGFMLALPGWLLTQFIFHWHLGNPATCGQGATSSGESLAHQCNFGALLVTMIVNLFIVGIGMAIVAIPVFPLLMKLNKAK
jgi:hypothetical protein